MNNTIPNPQPEVNTPIPEPVNNMGTGNMAQPQGDPASDPSVFLAQQILEIKNELKTEIEAMKKAQIPPPTDMKSELEVIKTEIRNTIKEEISGLRKLIESALNEPDSNEPEN